MHKAIGKFQFCRGSQVGTFRIVYEGKDVGEVVQGRDDKGFRYWFIAEDPTRQYRTRDAAAVKWVVDNSLFL